jgi:lysophospholipase L1-like esterase
MIHDEFPTVSLHNVFEIVPADWTDGGYCPHRIPESIGAQLNVDARERMRHPAGCEIRFVPEDGPIEVTLSAANEVPFRVFWGEFQESEVYELGSQPTIIEIDIPPQIDTLRSDIARRGAFDPQVCRVRFEAWDPVAIHDVRGWCRPPATDELPNRRYLAYGTSITEGAAASACHLSYVSHVARELALDALNLGASGAAFCEPAIADHIAGEDWDIATLSLSVNMANRGFTLMQFQERTRVLVDRVARAHPGHPVACVTLFPYHADAVREDDLNRAIDFRDVLRDIVATSPHDNVHLVEGPELMDVEGLTTDVLHPGDAGMASIGDGLADALRTLLD